MKKTWIALVLVALLLLGAGCAAATPHSTSEISRGNAAVAPVPAPAASSAPAAMPAADSKAGFGTGSAETANGSTQDTAGTADQYGGHKVIQTASLSLETRDFDTALAHIKQKATDMGGYMASSSVSGRKPENYGDAGRYASLSARIPQEKLDLFLSDTRGIATVISENSSGEDITSAYFDTDSRLKIYQTERDRIQALLEKATTMEDIIKLETQLSNLTYEIEGLTTQLKRWDNLVNFATVNIELSEITVAKPVASNDTFGTRISEGLRDTLSGLAVFFENFAVFLIVASPVLVILAVIVVVIVLLVKRSNKRRAAMRANMPPPYGYPPAPPTPLTPPAPPVPPTPATQPENKKEE